VARDRQGEMIRLERHPLGPRLHVAGVRVHEWYLGLVLMVAAVVSAVAQVGQAVHLTALAAAAGAYLIAKDWRDLLPSTRDTGAWRLGLHRPPAALRPTGRADWLPPLAGWLAAGVGVVNLSSALGPELPGRLRAVAQVAPPEMVVGAHALTLPAGLALVAASVFLRARRQRAQRAAVVLLVGLGALDLLRGPDVAEAAMSVGLAGLLVWGRAAFRVRHDSHGLRRALRRAGTLWAGAVTAAVAAVAACAHWVTPEPSAVGVLREAIGSLVLVGGPLHLEGRSAWVPGAIGALGAVTAGVTAWLLLRPLSASLAPCTRRDRAAAIVRRHGHDTLSFFKLREDLPRHFSPDGRAFFAYRIDSGVMLLSGDPVGPVDALDALLADVCAFADDHGLRVASLGAGEAFADRARSAGLRKFYIGDEAIVDTATFTLEGKAIKKVRQATHRLKKAGYTVRALTLGALTDAEVAALEAVSARWRDGAPERGFSMAMDSLRNPALSDSMVVVAYDAELQPRGFLHFVPSGGRSALSLSSMRRDRDTPNGLTDFLIVEAISLARDRGVDELSLNFAAFARYLRDPTNRLQRVLGRLARLANPYFQIESLYSFNAKFFPRWQPRYLLYDGFASLPRTALAALWAEGQLPRPPRLAARLTGSQSDRSPGQRTAPYGPLDARS